MIIRNPHCAKNRLPGERATDLPQTRKRGLSGVLSGRASLKLDTPNLVGNAPLSNYFFAEFRGFSRLAKRQRSIPPKSRTRPASCNRVRIGVDPLSLNADCGIIFFGGRGGVIWEIPA